MNPTLRLMIKSPAIYKITLISIISLFSISQSCNAQETNPINNPSAHHKYAYDSIYNDSSSADFSSRIVDAKQMRKDSLKLDSLFVSNQNMIDHIDRLIAQSHDASNTLLLQKLRARILSVQEIIKNTKERNQSINETILNADPIQKKSTQ